MDLKKTVQSKQKMINEEKKIMEQNETLFDVKELVYIESELEKFLNIEMYEIQRKYNTSEKLSFDILLKDFFLKKGGPNFLDDEKIINESYNLYEQISNCLEIEIIKERPGKLKEFTKMLSKNFLKNSIDYYKYYRLMILLEIEREHLIRSKTSHSLENYDPNKDSFLSIKVTKGTFNSNLNEQFSLFVACNINDTFIKSNTILRNNFPEWNYTFILDSALKNEIENYEFLVINNEDQTTLGAFSINLNEIIQHTFLSNKVILVKSPNNIESGNSGALKKKSLLAISTLLNENERLSLDNKNNIMEELASRKNVLEFLVEINLNFKFSEKIFILRDERINNLNLIMNDVIKKMIDIQKSIEKSLIPFPLLKSFFVPEKGFVFVQKPNKIDLSFKCSRCRNKQDQNDDEELNNVNQCKLI